MRVGTPRYSFLEKSTGNPFHTCGLGLLYSLVHTKALGQEQSGDTIARGLVCIQSGKTQIFPIIPYGILGGFFSVQKAQMQAFQT